MTKTPHKHNHSRYFGAAAIGVWAIAIVGTLGALAFYAHTVLPSGQMAAVITSSLVQLTNEDRKEQDLGSLKVNPLLVAAAQAKADDMAAKGYFAHTSPDGSSSWSWFKGAGYSFSHAGENLAVNFSDSVDVEKAWMNSPTHRANILNGNFTEVGIATAVGEYQGKKTVFVVQMFGTPAGGAKPVAVATETVPEDPNEPAIATAEREPEVLGTESAGPAAEGVAASAVAPGAEEQAPVPVEEAPHPQLEPVADLIPAPVTVASSPKTLLQALYVFAGIALIVLFGFITRLELRRHHVRHVFAVSFLFVLMGGLLVVANQFLFPTLVIGQEIAE